jgi:glycosyl transferase, family 25
MFQAFSFHCVLPLTADMFLRWTLPCFVISLKRSIDRREHITREFDREGIRFDFVDAVDGRELRSSKRISPSLGLPIIPADIACTMSHGLAMKAMLERGHDRAIIFEDDARLAPGFASTVEVLLSAPIEWGFLKLCGPSVHFSKSVAFCGYNFVWPDTPATCAAGYVITSAAARKLIPLTDPAHDVFDHIVQQTWKTKISVVEVFPRLVSWTGMPSTIARGRVYHRDTFSAVWRRRLFLLRKSIWKRMHI